MSPKSNDRIIVGPFETRHRRPLPFPPTTLLDGPSHPEEDANDEEIDEDCAFDDVYDEKAYDALLSSPKMRSGNVTLSVVPTTAAAASRFGGGRRPAFVDVAGGSKMTLSAACLDVTSCDFRYVKLMYRCVYPKGGGGGERP